MKCYHCQQLGHPTYRCPEKSSTSQGSTKRVNYVQEESSSSNKHSEVPLESEEGENLMIRRTLIKELVKEEPSQRRALFRI
jgi:hypothetical protein